MYPKINLGFREGIYELKSTTYGCQKINSSSLDQPFVFLRDLVSVIADSTVCEEWLLPPHDCAEGVVRTGNYFIVLHSANF